MRDDQPHDSHTISGFLAEVWRRLPFQRDDDLLKVFRLSVAPCVRIRAAWVFEREFLQSAALEENAFALTYLVKDFWIRMILGRGVRLEESANLARALLTEACRRENVEKGYLSLHSNSDDPARGSTSH